METRANYAIVGLFTLLVIAASFGFVYWMTNYGRTGDIAPLNIRIPGSANGLSVGSPVRFNGISVGSVRSLTIDDRDPSFVLARTDVRADAPVTASTRAVLEIQGLTGAAYIEMAAGPVEGPNILQQALETGQPAELIADPSSVTNLLSTADQILTRANEMVGELEGFVRDAREPLTNTLRNTEVFSQALSDNADGIDEFLQSVSVLSGTFTSLSGRLDTTFEAAENLMMSIDPQKIDGILANVEQVTADLTEASGGVTEVVESFNRTADLVQTFTTTAGATIDRLDGIVANVDSIVASVDPVQIGSTLDNIAVASGEARQAIANAQDLTQRFGERGDDIERVISDITEMASRFNAVSARVDTVVGRVDTALGEADMANILADIDAAVTGIRDITAAVDAARVSEAVDDIAVASRSAREAVANAEQLTQRFGERGEDIDQVISDITEMASRFNAVSARVDTVVGRVDSALGEADMANILADIDAAVTGIRDITAAVDAARVREAVDDISVASRSAREAVANAEQFTRQFGEREDDIEKFITDVTQMAERLNAASVRVDAVLAKVDGFLGDGDASNLLAEAEQTVIAFRNVADSINARIGPIAANLERFSGGGLRDVESLVTETRRSIGRIERAITGFERNPQRLLFGGEEVKQFDGRTRR